MLKMLGEPWNSGFVFGSLLKICSVTCCLSQHISSNLKISSFCHPVSICTNESSRILFLLQRCSYGRGGREKNGLLVDVSTILHILVVSVSKSNQERAPLSIRYNAIRKYCSSVTILLQDFFLLREYYCKRVSVPLRIPYIKTILPFFPDEEPLAQNTGTNSDLSRTLTLILRVVANLCTARYLQQLKHDYILIKFKKMLDHEKASLRH